MSKIQSVLFDHHKWTTSEAKQWMSQHHMQAIKNVHETAHNYRYRIRNPHQFSRYITKKFGKGIEAVIGFK